LPNLAESFYAQGVKYFNSKDYARAGNDFKIATVLSPKNGKYFAYLAYTYHWQKDERTEEAYLKALSLDYKTQLFYTGLGSFYQSEKKDYDSAIRYYQKAIELYPDKYAFAYDQLILLFLRLDRKDEAVSTAENLVQKFPLNAQGFNFLGIAYSRSARFKEAELAFQKSIQLEPNNPAWVTRFAEMLMIKGDTKRAMQEYEKALNLAPLYDEALCKITHAFNKNGDYEKTVSYANKAIKERPDSAWLPICFYNLGYAHLSLGHKTEAGTAFENYLERAKSLPENELNQKYIQNAENELKKLSP
jgi:tetratricopeptide (TPR) repeat protein